MNAEQKLVQRLVRLPVAAVSDSLDNFGLRCGVMSAAVRPLARHMAFAGTAFPLQAVPRSSDAEHSGRPTYNLGIEAVDAIPAGAVVVVATGGFCRAAVWGELLSTRAQALGAVGAVTDGAVRDSAGILRLEFPTYAAARCAKDAQGRMAVVSYNEAVVCGEVPVNPGDLVLADLDGVVIVPRNGAEEVVVEAERRVSGEDVVRRDLRSGRTVAAVFDDYGLL